MRPKFTVYESLGGIHEQPLEEVLGHVEEQARMILPGIQTLFGFQLIAVFNQKFADLSPLEQRLHLAALLLTALSVVFAVAPAAFHRQAMPNEIAPFLARFGTRMLTLALVPLVAGTSIDLYVISRFLTDSVPVALAIAGAFGLLSVALWFVFPQAYKARLRPRRPRPPRRVW
jgi:hypothetical protein